MECLIHHLVYHTALFLIRNSFHNQRNVTAAHGIFSFRSMLTTILKDLVDVGMDFLRHGCSLIRLQ